MALSGNSPEETGSCLGSASTSHRPASVRCLKMEVHMPFPIHCVHWASNHATMRHQLCTRPVREGAGQLIQATALRLWGDSAFRFLLGVPWRSPPALVWSEGDRIVPCTGQPLPSVPPQPWGTCYLLQPGKPPHSAEANEVSVRSGAPGSRHVRPRAPPRSGGLT